jgi:integrase/recombinase XerD
VKNNRTRQLDGAITPDGIYKLVRAYSAALGFEIGAHSLRATAATNALDLPPLPETLRCGTPARAESL